MTLTLPEKHNKSSDNIPVGRKHQSRFREKREEYVIDVESNQMTEDYIGDLVAYQ